MAPARPGLVIGDTDMPPGFVTQTVLSSTASTLVLHAPPGVIRWTLDGDSCSVSQTWLVIPEGGSPGGGGFGGAGCPWAPHLSIGARASLGSNGAHFSVIGGRVLPPDNVQIRVELANGAQMTVQPHDAMWLVIVQRCGDYDGTEITSVELLGADDSLIERKVLEPAGNPRETPASCCAPAARTTLLWIIPGSLRTTFIPMGQSGRGTSGGGGLSAASAKEIESSTVSTCALMTS